MTDEQIAKVAHEVNRTVCLAQGDNSQPSWDDAPDWQRTSALNGVRAIRDGVVTSPKQSHESWLAEKEGDGWVWGFEKDPEAKKHPCMLPYAELPFEQRVKDSVFTGIVQQLLTSETSGA